MSGNWLAEQIRLAKAEAAKWPDWMKLRHVKCPRCNGEGTIQVIEEIDGSIREAKSP